VNFALREADRQKKADLKSKLAAAGKELSATHASL